MSIQLSDIKTTDDLIKWVFHHEGVIETRWEAQFKDNRILKDRVRECEEEVRRMDSIVMSNEGATARNSVAVDKLDERVTNLERKIWIAAGAAAAVGSMLGTLLSAKLPI